MSDPARYNVDALLDDSTGIPIASIYTERAKSGAWIKWADFEDYKAAQRRNKNADAVTRLGVEVAQVRCELEELREENKRLRNERA